MDGWCVWRSRIVAVGLEECRDVIDGFVNSAQKICVRCRHVDEITGKN